MEDRIQVDLKDGVADVRLVRADKMNALDDHMFQALIDTGEALKTRPGVRAIVLSGEGKAFCAGLDMGNFGKMASGERKGGSETGAHRVLRYPVRQRMRRRTMPVNGGRGRENRRFSDGAALRPQVSVSPLRLAAQPAR